MKLTLVRIGEYQDATFGALSIDGRPYFTTLEDKWRNNEKMVSCIPKGKYKIAAHRSPKFGECYQVLNVPNRSHILIHAGNTHVDTHGCILLGLTFSTEGDQAKILSSRAAIAKFMQLLSGELEADLEVR
jgi:hypothetical protein